MQSNSLVQINRPYRPNMNEIVNYLNDTETHYFPRSLNTRRVRHFRTIQSIQNNNNRRNISLYNNRQINYPRKNNRKRKNAEQNYSFWKNILIGGYTLIKYFLNTINLEFFF